MSPASYHCSTSLIINRLLEESRKMGSTTSESSKMKMALLSNTTKSGKGGKSSWKTGGSKKGVKKDLHCDSCNKNSHEEQTCWEKYSHMKPKKEENEEKRGNTKFAITMMIKTMTSIIPQISKTNDME